MRFGWVVVGLAVAVAFGSVVVAQKSGEALADHVDPTALTRAHVEMGDAVLPWASASSPSPASGDGARHLADAGAGEGPGRESGAR